MKRTFTTLYEVVQPVFRAKKPRFFRHDVERVALSMGVQRVGVSSPVLIVELEGDGTDPNSETVLLGFGSTYVTVESDRRNPEATILMRPLDNGRSLLKVVVDRQALPRKLR